MRLARYVGDVWGIDFPVYRIVADVGINESAGIVLAHNHPSGDPTPSAADRRATRRLACALDAMDCTIIDHLVFGGNRCASFRQLGLL